MSIHILTHSVPSRGSSDAQKTGVAQEAVKSATGKIGQMTSQEAKLILGIEKDLPWGEVVKVSEGCRTGY